MTALLASFAAAGGAPPASYELVRVLRDGTVRALAGTAWPGFGPASEAGVYEFALDGAAVADVERLAGDPGLERELDGTLESGSGRLVLGLSGGRKLRWDPFTTPPAPAAALAEALQALLGEARGHPLAAVRLDIAATPREIGYTFTALGREPVELTVPGAAWARVVEAPEPPTDPPPIAWVREAVGVETEGGGSARLAPGETLALRGALGAPPAGARLRVDGFARVALDLAALGEAKIEATLAAGPASGTT